MINDLYKTALLGTNRMTPSVSTLEQLREMEINTDDATEAVLTGIGMLALARKAGYTYSSFKGIMPLQYLPETEKYMSSKAAKYIKDIVDKKMPVFVYMHTLFLYLAAECAVQNNKIAPIDLLPSLLNKASHPSVAKILGNRGIWLAEQNPRWKDLLYQKVLPKKMSAIETSTLKLLTDIPLKSIPNMYEKIFDIIKKTGLVDDSAARVALFWCTVVEEMER